MHKYLILIYLIIKSHLLILKVVFYCCHFYSAVYVKLYINCLLKSIVD